MGPPSPIARPTSDRCCSSALPSGLQQDSVDPLQFTFMNSIRTLPRNHATLVATGCLIGLFLGSAPALGQENPALGQGNPALGQGNTAAEIPAEDSLELSSEIRFSFNAAPWREVIEWVAEEADMALQYGEMPTGSFTYHDAGVFTPNEAISRINLFLIPQGYSIVQTGNLLAVVNLGDARSLAQLDALAELVSPDQLASLDQQDVVKCLFKLSELDAGDAVDELSALQLMTTPKVLSKTNQLMITDTVAKLLAVRAVLEAFEPSTMSNGTVVKSFRLQYVDAEDVLVVARPHLGLATDEMIGIDVSLSADTQGKSIFATGIEDKIKLIEGLVEAIDQPDADAEQMQRDSILKSYPIEGGNVELVYDVLQTLLAGKSVRLSMDEAAGSIVALADETTQREIELTVAELQASDAVFEVIPLQSVDAYYAISLLEEMLDLSPSLDDDLDPNAPKIDADAANRRLFVRAKRPQIEQIKAIIADLEASQPTAGDENFRILPMSANQSARVLKTAIQFWRGENSIERIPNEAASPVETERVPAQPEPREQPQAEDAFTPVDGSTRESLRGSPFETTKTQFDRARTPFDRTGARTGAGATPFIDHHSLANVTPSARETDSVTDAAPAIQCQITENGLLLQSHDTEALDRFEDLVRVVLGPNDAIISTPIVFYMQYTRSDDALRMLAKLLDGGESAKDVGEASLINGYVDSPSSFLLGSYLSTSEGTLTLTTGATTVVSDTRLNRLIAQGAAEDIESIEGYLRIIDKPTGATDVLTYGQSRVIELTNIKASEAADVIRQAFGDRVVSSSKSSGADAEGGKPAPAPKPTKASADAQKLAALSKASQPKDLAPKMTVAVHEPSNSLIVTAPDSLLEQVESLIQSIDSRGEQSIEVIVPTNVLAVEAALEGLMIETTSRSRTPSRDTRSKSGR